MKMDYRETKEGVGFIEPGFYVVDINDVIAKATEKEGHTLWEIEFKIATNNEFYDRKIKDNIIFMPSLESRNKGIFRALGYDVDTQEFEAEPNDLLNKRVKIEIIKEEYEKYGQQKETRKVKFFDGWSALTQENDASSIPF